jgi:eukaryotic-like serine/threonine-protein kinase
MTHFGPYQVLDRVGAGATGTVYRARAADSGQVVAVKELSAALRADPAALDRLRHEARLLRGLAHPNIVAVHDFVEEPEGAFLVSEYVDGAPLTAVLTTHGQLGAESALAVLRGALTGLGFAHRLGVVHGDISLDNIMLTVDGTSKLIDFGVASPTGQARVAGTPAFISPEAVLGSPRTTASDVYSAAAVLWTLLAGRPPFPGSDVQTVLQAQLHQPPPRLEGHGPELAHLLERALAKDPALRPPDAAAFLAELERAAERQYGADWPTRASLGGLAATTSAALLAATAGGAAPAAPAVVASSVLGEAAPISALSASPEVVGTSLTTPAVGAPAAAGPAGSVVTPAPPPAPAPSPTVAYTPQPPRNPHKGAWIAGGVGTVIAVAIIVVLIVVLGGGSGETPGTEAASTSDAQSSEPAPQPAGPAPPTGAYTIHSVVTVEDPIWDTSRTGELTTTYTFAFDCADVPCTGSATGPDGAPFPDGTTVTFDGTTLHLESSYEVDFICFVQFGIPYDGSVTTRVDEVGDYVVGEAADGERPPLSGQNVTTFTPTGTKGDCPIQPAGTSIRQVTLTPA